MTEAQIKAIESIPVTEEEVKQWMDECDAGLHPLSKADEKALARSWEILRARIFGEPSIAMTE
jgi:hypothetical protein